MDDRTPRRSRVVADPTGVAPRVRSGGSRAAAYAQLRWGEPEGALRSSFERFWPRDSASPPVLPWLGALTDRPGAWAWAVAFAGEARTLDPADPEAVLQFVRYVLGSELPEAESLRKLLCPNRAGPAAPSFGCDHYQDMCFDYCKNRGGVGHFSCPPTDPTAFECRCNSTIETAEPTSPWGRP